MKLKLTQDNDKDGLTRKYGPALALGTNLTAGMVLCSLGGYYIDGKFGVEENYFTLGGMFVGLLYCAYEVWKIVRTSE